MIIKNIGIYLNTALKNLKRAVEKAETGTPIIKQVTIFENQCDRFLRSHGSYGEIADKIKLMKSEAKSIKFVANKTMNREQMKEFVEKIEKIHEQAEDIDSTIHYQLAA